MTCIGDPVRLRPSSIIHRYLKRKCTGNQPTDTSVSYSVLVEYVHYNITLDYAPTFLTSEHSFATSAA